MKKKLLVFSFLFASLVVILPSQGLAAPADPVVTAKTSPPQIRIQVGRRYNRGRHYGWYRGRHNGWNRDRARWERNRNTTVRQVYWMNGRRYTRTVRRY